MFLFDATHTSHTSAQTGIQRVCRSFFAELDREGKAAPVSYDPHWIGWRALRKDERDVLRDQSGGTGKSRGAKWTWPQKISGAGQRWLGKKPGLPAASGLICPELFSAKVGRQLPDLLSVAPGPRVAIFYDAIPLKFPELTPSGTVARFPSYLRELLLFDGVAAISEDSATSLRDYWQWLGVNSTPAVQAIPLGVDPLAVRAGSDRRTHRAAVPRILCVCTIEGRKNHLALLEACEMLWKENRLFELHLVGMARPDTAGAAIARIESLRRAGRALIFGGSISAAALDVAYRRCDFTVYPSLSEGFGLPVLESLQYGKPCICSARGALGESAHGGGCVPLGSVDARSLADAMGRLLKNHSELEQLAEAARRRVLRTWRDYSNDFQSWMGVLPRRS